MSEVRYKEALLQILYASEGDECCQNHVKGDAADAVGGVEHWDWCPWHIAYNALYPSPLPVEPEEKK